MEASSSYNFEYRETTPFGTSVEIVEIVSDHRNEEPTTTSTKDRFLTVLDRLQKDVERLRSNAQTLEDQKDSLLTNLDTLRHSKTLQSLEEGEQSELENYMDMISQRCQTVNVKVNTPRDNGQEDSLHKVNTLIDGIILALQQDPMGTQGRCLSYMSACSARDEHETLVAMVTGLQPVRTDKGFESALLGCTLDDQKNVKRRLRGLLEYISNVHPL